MLGARLALATGTRSAVIWPMSSAASAPLKLMVKVLTLLEVSQVTEMGPPVLGDATPSSPATATRMVSASLRGLLAKVSGADVLSPSLSTKRLLALAWVLMILSTCCSSLASPRLSSAIGSVILVLPSDRLKTESGPSASGATFKSSTCNSETPSTRATI